MPRFGTRTLLIVFALAAVWFATFGASSNSLASVMAAQDVRRSMLLLILIAATGMALSSTGRRRAFWLAFAIVMLLCGGLNLQRPLHRYVPDFAWQQVVGSGAVSPYLMPAPTPAPVASTRMTGRGQVVYSYSAPTAATPYTAFTTAGIGSSPGWLALSETAAAAWTFALAALCGFVAAFIYSRSRPAADTFSSTPRQIVEQELQR
jgi:hypothetical protein